MSIIDAHHHLWDLSVRDQPWISGPEMAPIRRSFSVADLRPLAQAAGVTATVLVQTVTVAAETPEMLALAATEPLLAGVVGWTDLTGPAVADELARLAAGPGGDRLVGIRHQVQSEPDPDWLRRPDVIRGLRAVAAPACATTSSCAPTSSRPLRTPPRPCPASRWSSTTRANRRSRRAS